MVGAVVVRDVDADGAVRLQQDFRLRLTAHLAHVNHVEQRAVLVGVPDDRGYNLVHPVPQPAVARHQDGTVHEVLVAFALEVLPVAPDAVAHPVPVGTVVDLLVRLEAAALAVLVLIQPVGVLGEKAIALGFFFRGILHPVLRSGSGFLIFYGFIFRIFSFFIFHNFSDFMLQI